MNKDLSEEQREVEMKNYLRRELIKLHAKDREEREEFEEYFKEIDEYKLQVRRDGDERIARLKQEVEEERELKDQLEKEAIELEELDLKRLTSEPIDDQRDVLKQEEDERLQADIKEQEERSEQGRQNTAMELEQERNAQQSIKDYENDGNGFKEYVNDSSALRFQKWSHIERPHQERGRQLEWHVRYQNAVQRNELDQWKSRDPENRDQYYQQRVEEMEQDAHIQLASEIEPVDLDQILAGYDEERGAPTQDDLLLKDELKDNANHILRESVNRDILDEGTISSQGNLTITVSDVTARGISINDISLTDAGGKTLTINNAIPTQDNILLKEALEKNANDVSIERQEGKDNIIQFPLNEPAQEESNTLTAEEWRETRAMVDHSINDIRPVLNKLEHALYESQLGYLMADKIAEHDKNELSNYIESFKDDPEKLGKISEYLLSLEALSEKELEQMKQAHLYPDPEDTEHDFLSDVEHDEMQMLDKVDDLYLNSLESNDRRIMADVNLSDAERQHNSAYRALDQWVEHHREHHPEVFSLVQEKAALLLQEMVEKWPEVDKLSQEIEQTHIREMQQLEQELGESFWARNDAGSTTELDEKGFGESFWAGVGAGSKTAFDDESFGEEEYTESLWEADYMERVNSSRGQVVEFPSHRVNQELTVEAGEGYSALVDRIAEEDWSAGAEYDTGDYDCYYDYDCSDKVNDLIGMDDGQAKELDKVEELAQPDQSINQKQQMKVNPERSDDDWDR